MIVSENIPLNVRDIQEEIIHRQTLPWNNGRIDDYEEFPTLQRLFDVMNSGIPPEDFFYRGDLFRIHSPYCIWAQRVNIEKEFIISRISLDNSCQVLPITSYSNKIVSFSKTFDFTDYMVFNKVYAQQKSIFIHISTQGLYGIDVNKFFDRYDIDSRFRGEQEVLFPLMKECVIKEYQCTPNQFCYYMRKQKKHQLL